MNRREAIAALVALPEVACISVAPVKPGDVLVLETIGYVTEEQAARIRKALEQVWPGHRCVVLGEGMRLKVMKDAP